MRQKLDRLKEWLAKKESLIVAFSGGIDSTLLLQVAYEVLGDRMMAFTIASPVNNPAETEQAKQIAAFVGVSHHTVIWHNDLMVSEVRHNHPERCYFCKKRRFEILLDIAKEKNIRYVVEGTNHDDLTDYRPGQKALKELHIESPLMLLGFTKKDIREASKLYQLPNWDKEPEPCLATRFPVNTVITEEALNQVIQSENFLQQMIKGKNKKNIRVRVHQNLARIEANPDCFEDIIKNKDTIKKAFLSAGFSYVSLDLGGYQTGNMNKESQS